MGGWAYVFWTIVFTLPVIGIILVVIFSLAGTNTNRKKFARSFLCWLLIDVIILIALVVYLAVLIKNSGLNGDVLTAMDAFFKALPRAIEIAMNNM